MPRTWGRALVGDDGEPPRACVTGWGGRDEGRHDHGIFECGVACHGRSNDGHMSGAEVKRVE